MPLTPRKANPALWITLDGGFERPFIPGQTITGHVHRSATLVTPDARVQIRLHGRTKSKLIQRHGANNNRSVYRGRFNLINDAENAVRLYEGPAHIPPGGDALSWPFAVTIPTHVSPRALCVARGNQDTFISTKPEDVSRHELPPTMGAWEDGYSNSVEGFVEYFLQADLSMTVKGKRDSFDATLPITLVHVLSDPPIGHFNTQHRKHARIVQTQLLLPGREDGHLSVKEKFKKAMGTPSVPIFHVQAQFDIPNVLQLGNPTPIPFIVELAPDWEKTSEKIRKLPQKVTLTSAEIKILTTTFVQAEGTFSTKRDETALEVDLGLMHRLRSRRLEVHRGTEDDWSPMDLGALADLRLSPDAIPALAQPGRGLNCSYTTYNVRQQHQLIWKVIFTAAGEEINISGRERLTILPASADFPAGEGGDNNNAWAPGPGMLATSASWMQPPPEAEAPPSFSHVQQEDKLAAKS